MSKKTIFSTEKIILLILAIGFSLFLVNQGFPPEFFDRFGVVIFAFLTMLGFWMIKTKKELSDNFAFLVFLIGVVGVIIDGSIIFGG